MKRLFALGGIVMLLLCFTMPVEATEYSAVIDFQDGTVGYYLMAQYVEKYVFFPPIPGMSNQFRWAGQWGLTGTNSGRYVGNLGAVPDPTQLPPGAPTDKAAGMALIFNAPLKSFSIDYAPGTGTDGAHAGTEIGCLVIDMTSMDMTADPLIEKYATLPSVGSWGTMSLSAAELADIDARMIILAAPVPNETDAACMGFDNLRFTLSAMPPNIEGGEMEVDVDGADLFAFADLYDQELRDDDDLDLFAYDYGLYLDLSQMPGFPTGS